MIADPADFPRTTAPDRPYRLIPSRFPPVAAFEAVASAEDLEAVFELEGWTNDRLAEHRLRRLPKEQWVYGRANASIVMAAFLHGAPGGTRFAGPELGAWYASRDEQTALLEVLNGLRREIALSALSAKTETYRTYRARLTGRFVDVRGAGQPLHSPTSYAASQPFGEQVRASRWAGIVYDSIRDPDGENVVCYRPTRILDVLQVAHWRAHVNLTGPVTVVRLDGK